MRSAAALRAAGSVAGRIAVISASPVALVGAFVIMPSGSKVFHPHFRQLDSRYRYLRCILNLRAPGEIKYTGFCVIACEDGNRVRRQQHSELKTALASSRAASDIARLRAHGSPPCVSTSTREIHSALPLARLLVRLHALLDVEVAGSLKWGPSGAQRPKSGPKLPAKISPKSLKFQWRPRPELNRGTRFCRPLRNHSATWP